MLLLQNFPPTKNLKLQVMRQQSEDLHQKANEKLIGTFKGIEEERKVKVDDNTG